MTSKQFYATKAWRKLSYVMRMSSGSVCDMCNNTFELSQLRAHHKAELNEFNINDVSISLNPDNIQVLCHSCHDRQHNRFGQGKQCVYIVYGSPLSGKSTYVDEVAEYGDVILDMDNIWQSVSGQDRYVKPNQLKPVVFNIRDNILESIRYRRGSWANAYIIGGYPNQMEREQLAQKLGAELIYIESDKEECIERAMERNSNWIEYVNSWWEEYNPPLIV